MPRAFDFLSPGVWFANPHNRFKLTPGDADASGMKRAQLLSARYRVTVTRPDDRTFVAASVELPAVTAVGQCPEEAVRALRERVTAALVDLVEAGDAPTPVREFEGQLGFWNADLELVDELPPPPAGLEMPDEATLRSIARFVADRYRVILEPQGEDGYIAACAEVPGAVVRGTTVAEVMEALRGDLVGRTYRVLEANGLPAEPLQDVESRERVQGAVVSGVGLRAA